MFRYILLILLIHFLLLENIFPQYHFKELDMNVGLKYVNSIYRDHEDYLWIGNLGIGLVKYDSYNSKVYEPDSTDSTSISHTNISCIFEDKSNTLWIGTRKGLNRYVREKDNFVRYYSDEKDPSCISSNYINNIVEFPNSGLWILTTKGLDHYNPENDCFNHFYPDEGDDFSGFKDMAVDKDGNYWCVGHKPGIYSFNPTTGKFHFFRNKYLASGKVPQSTLLIDKENHFWIGFYGNRLYQYDPKTNEYFPFSTSGDGKGTKGSLIMDIKQINDSIILIGLDQGGINEYNKNSKTFTYITSNNPKYGNLTSDGINCMHIDNEGILWIGTTRGGICFNNDKLINFHSYKPTKGQVKSTTNKSTSITHGIIGCLLEDSDGLIWIGTDGGGINVYNPKTNDFNVFMHIPNSQNSLSSNVIRSIQEDADGVIWIMSWDNNIVSYNKKNQRFKQHEFKRLPDETGNKAKNYWSLFIDSKNRFWISYPNGEVDLFDKNEKCKGQYFKDISIRVNVPPQFSESPKEEIYICNRDGLFKYNEKNDHMDLLIKQKNTMYSSIDTDNSIWLATTGDGIFHYTENGKLLNHYTESKNITNNYICSIGFDENYVWFSTNSGLNMLDKKTEKIIPFYENDGLPNNQFFEQSYMKTSDGKHFFGTSNGFVWFDPLKIKINQFIPQVHLTNLFLSDERINLYGEGDDIKDTIIIPWKKDNILSIQFLAINYTDPYNNNYAYYLEGMDTYWHKTNAYQRKASYTNLDPGEYTFIVKASNNNNIWNEEGNSIKIIIPTPFWKTKLAYGFALVLLLVMIRFSWYLRERKIKSDRNNLEFKVKERTKIIEKQHHKLEQQNEELQAQKNELFLHRNRLEKLVDQRTNDLQLAKEKAEESDRLKSNFLANMSHEIRTPMNAIIGFSTLLDTPDFTDEEKKDFRSLIRSNSESLLYLIEDIMDFSMIESNQLKLINKKFTLNVFINQIFESFSLRHTINSVELILNNQLLNDNLMIDSDEFRIKQIIDNLINNAIKFTSKGYIEIGCKKNNQFIQFYVKDTGHGIAQNDIKSIFMQFVKLKEDQQTAKRGVGLGLTISKKLAELLGGHLDVASEISVGSEFTLYLPITILA